MSGTCDGMTESYVDHITVAHSPGRTRFERVTSRDLSHSYKTLPTKNVESPEHGTLSLPIRYSAWVPQDCAKPAWWTRITLLAYVASGEGL